jgi:natural product precursor
MSKKFSKKLILKKETISNLRYGEMNNLKGGGEFTHNSCIWTCYPCDTGMQSCNLCSPPTVQMTCRTGVCYCL